MQQRELLYGIIGLLIGGVSVWFLAANAINSNNSNMMQLMGIRGRDQGQIVNSNTIDAHFIEQMIPHHEDAITMAKLAEGKAKHSEIKTLSQNIIDSQSKEIDQMRSWYMNWFDKEVPTGTQTMNQHGMMGGSDMHMGMMGNETDLTRLEQAIDFDKEFIEEMIPHHQMAVMMAQMLKNSTSREEMSKLADDIISAQTKEIAQMRQWNKSWGN
jgi:uncharacterized protein (DUF305 family)